MASGGTESADGKGEPGRIQEGSDVPIVGLEIHPMIRRSQEAFRRDLPLLLQDKNMYRQWVAYHGDERIGIDPSANTLLIECARRGLKEHEYVVRFIAPELPPDMDATPLYDV